MIISRLTHGKWYGESDYLLKDHKIIDKLTPETDIAIYSTQPIDFADIKHLKGIVRLGAGYDNVPVKQCNDAGIIMAYTSNAPSQSVAEHTLALIMSSLRFTDRQHPTRLLSSLTIAIIGRGRIGKRVAYILNRLGVKRLLVVDPVADTTFDECNNCQRVSLEVALISADIVSLHIPKDAETLGMIGWYELEIMQENAILINTSRGGIVGEKHLLSHLRAHPRFKAALDVFEEEPYSGRLLCENNCICTPHVAAMTMEARRRMEQEAMEAVLSIAQGRKPEWAIPI